MEMSTTKKTAYLGMLTSLAVIMGYVEYLIPVRFPVPGVKLGLANIVTVFVLYRFGFRPALAVSLVRILISGLLFGSVSGILYSLTGMLFSLPVMAQMKNRSCFSVIGVSAAGAALFNTGQIAAAMAAAGPVIVRYLPVLLIAGDITGIIIGAIDLILIRRLSSVRISNEIP